MNKYDGFKISSFERLLSDLPQTSVYECIIDVNQPICSAFFFFFSDFILNAVVQAVASRFKKLHLAHRLLGLMPLKRFPFAWLPFGRFF